MKLLVHSLLILLTISTALNGLIHRPSSFSKGKCSLFSIKQDFIPSIGLESQISHLGNFRPLSLVEYSYAFQLFPNLKNAALKKQWPSFRDLEQFEKNWMEAAASSAPLSIASTTHEINFCRDTEFICDKEFITSNFPSSLTIGSRDFSQKIFIDFASLWNCLINGVNGLRLSTSSEETLRLRGNMLIALQQVLHKQIDDSREAIVVLQYPSDVSARDLSAKWPSFLPKISIELLIRCNFLQLTTGETEDNIMPGFQKLDDEKPDRFIFCSK